MGIHLGSGYWAAMGRLVELLQLPPTTTELTLNFPADCLARCTVTWLLSPEEIDQISTWYELEDPDRIPEGTTTYTLEFKPKAPQSELLLQCSPTEQQARQEQLEALYEADGRHDPAHPAHGLYTGLVAGPAATRDTANPDEVEEAL